jgi:hypothetical protein
LIVLKSKTFTDLFSLGLFSPSSDECFKQTVLKASAAIPKNYAVSRT